MFKVKSYNYKPICIAILIVCTMNLLFSVFTGSTPAVNKSNISHDGYCVCDGLDVNCTNEIILPARDYQIEMQLNSMVIYDGDRVVDVIPYGGKCNIQEILFKDNE